MPSKLPDKWDGEVTRELVDEICQRIAEGESLAKICADPAFPSTYTVRRWGTLQTPIHRYWQRMHAAARQDQADFYAESIIEIADSETDSDMAQLVKIRVDARKWVAAKMRPGTYGTQEQRVAITGADGGPLALTASHQDLSSYTEEELKMMAEIHRKARERVSAGGRPRIGPGSAESDGDREGAVEVVEEA